MSSGNYFNLRERDLAYLRANLNTDPQLANVASLLKLYQRCPEAGALGLLQGAVREWEKLRESEPPIPESGK